jgi:hypothetical protein
MAMNGSSARLGQDAHDACTRAGMIRTATSWLLAALVCGCDSGPPASDHAVALDIDRPLATTVEAIWGSGSDDVFLVGHDGERGVVEHFSGVTWSRMNAKAQWSVAGTGRRDVWTVGLDVLHYAGESWQHPLPLVAETGGSARGVQPFALEGRREVWIVGTRLLGEVDGVSTRADVWHARFDGEDAVLAPVEVPLEGAIRGVVGLSRSHLWIFGDGGLAHYDGIAFTRSDDRAVEAASLSGTDAWFVGSRALLRADGERLVPIDVGAVLTPDAELHAVWASIDGVWLGGTGGLLARWDGHSWSRVDIGSRDVRALWGYGSDLWMGGPGWVGRLRRR